MPNSDQPTSAHVPRGGGLVIDGEIVELSHFPVEMPLFRRLGDLDLDVFNYKTFPAIALKRGEDWVPRTGEWICNIIVHTTKGLAPVYVAPGFGPDTNVHERVIENVWNIDNRHAGAHLTVDFNGSIGCHADLRKANAYHAPPQNYRSIGIEMFQGRDGRLYEGQVYITALLIHWITAYFGVQRQMPKLRRRTVISRLSRGDDVVGVFGHRHVGGRGPGDPGDPIFEKLADWGYLEFAFDFEPTRVPAGHDFDTYAYDDKGFWARLQQQYDLRVDGVPGPRTHDMLRAAGYQHGIWRPPERPAE